MSVLEPTSALAEAARPHRGGAPGPEPLVVAERRLSIALLQASLGREATLREAIALALGLQLPESGHASTAGSVTAVWLQPGCWLVTAPRSAGSDLVHRLMAASGGAAVAVDQTFGKCVLRISGAPARNVLAKGCRIDLHPRAFGPARAATTIIAQISCTVVQADDRPAFDLIVPSTFAEALLDWLLISAAEYGYEIREPTE